MKFDTSSVSGGAGLHCAAAMPLGPGVVRVLTFRYQPLPGSLAAYSDLLPFFTHLVCFQRVAVPNG